MPEAGDAVVAAVTRMTRAQWTLLLLLVASIFLNYIDRSNLALAADIIQKEFALSYTDIGKLSSAFFWTYALFQLFGIAGWFADRYPVRLVLAGGLFLWSAATILTGALSGFSALFAARLLLGVGESVAYPCYSRIFATDIPMEHRGKANAMIDAGSKLGPALGTLVGGLLLEAVGWRMFFVVLGIASMLWLVPWFSVSGAGHRPALPEKGAQPTVLQILAQRSAWGAFLGHFCGNYFWYFLLTWLPLYLVKHRGFTTGEMVSITSTAFLAIACATLIAGWVSDRWIARGGTPTRVRKTVVVTGLCGSTVILPAALVRDNTTAMIFLAFGCLAFGIYVSNHWAITQTLAGPLAAGRWTSLQNGVGNLSGIVGAWLTGVVVDRTGSFVVAFAVAAGVALTGALLWGAVVGPVRQVEWKTEVIA
jgi:ACS family D-galactonate transporter-like MFS transporter